MRYLSIIALALVGACDSDTKDPTINIDVHLPEIEDIDEPVDEDEISEQEGVYYVPDLGDQVQQTNTRLEYVDGYSYSLPSGDQTLSSDLDCIVANFRVPADAGQGVVITYVEWGAVGVDSEQSGWIDHMDTVGHGSNIMILGDLQLFWDADKLAGTELVYEVWQYDPLSDWSTMFTCSSDFCDHTAFGANPGFYVPVGTVSVGFCTAWQLDWDNPEEAPASNDWHKSLLSKIWWSPADSQEFVSGSIQGLSLPVTSDAFPEDN